MRLRVWIGCGGLLTLLLAALVGYHVLMGWDVRQSLFFTIITISSIGYDDYDLTPAATNFTMVVILVGIACWTLLLASVVEYAADHWEGARRRRMEQEVRRLKGHFIVIGYGAVGREVAKYLRREGREVVVIDERPEAVERAREDGYHALLGDATVEETLDRAAIRAAAGMLAVTRSDPVNVFVTLTARGMCPELYIAANGIQAGVAEKLRRAGATVVVSPYEIGAQRLALAALSPHVAELLGGHDEDVGTALILREAELEAASPICGKALRDSGLRETTQVALAALKDIRSGEVLVNPPPDRVLQAGDILIAFGRRDQMPAFLRLVAPAAAQELLALE